MHGFQKFFNFTAESRDPLLTEPTNDSVDAILSMVPSVLHKFLTPKTRNQTLVASRKYKPKFPPRDLLYIQ